MEITTLQPEIAFYLPTAIVTKDIESSEVGEKAASVDVATGDRDSHRVWVDVNRGFKRSHCME